MKPSLLIAFLSLAATTLSAAAAPDRSYYVTELTAQQRFDVYNDGQNTYLESIPGLVVTGATADGERYIVNGVPSQIRGFMNGKPITVVRGMPPTPKPVQQDAAAVNAQIKQLTEKLETLSAKVAPKPAPPASSGSAPQAGSSAGTANPARATLALATAAGAGAASPAAAPVAEKAWDVRLGDKTIFGAMKRWSKTAGWQLMWDTEGNDYPVIAEATYRGEFDSAVGGVMASLQRSQYPLRACLYDNRAVRVIHKSKRCEG